MKRTLRPFLLASCCFALSANAQISIGPADMPDPGDTVRFRNGTTTVDMDNTGPDFTWDFSGLVPGAEGADTAVTVGSTPFLYQFFFNNALLYPENKADLAMRGADMGVQAVQINDVFNYFKSNSAGYRDVGFGANINGLPTSVQRTPVDWIYRFPMDFGNTDSSASHFEISVPTLGFYGQDQVRRNEVDGWGTLILPADTFQVLRVKSRLQRTDTVYIDQFGLGFALPEPETIEYKWLAQGMDEPVLQVTSVAGVNSLVRFYYHPEDISTGMESPAPKEVLRAWPNPAGNTLHIEGMPQGGLDLVSADGRTVRSLLQGVSTRISVDVHDLAPGLYLLRTRQGGAAQRVVIAH
ncbi:MAG: T9SS type A sorting domain-containing protein [Bacteroidetes bacterium]|nr:T9SS type A sorting domain-containing protein [Bacteroidota bacterium]